MSYDRQIALATRLIATRGKNITITKSTVTATVIATGKQTSTKTSMTIKAVVLPMTKNSDLAYRSEDSSITKLNTFLMSGENLKFKPETGQSVTISGETWIILGITPLNPNDGDPIMYDVAIRI